VTRPAATPAKADQCTAHFLLAAALLLPR
jgi:hypothetical protein